MKFNSGRSVLGLIIVLASISLFYGHLTSCKKDDSPQTALIVTVVDANNAPISGAKITVSVKADSTHAYAAPGFPKIQYTDGSGQTTFNFENGIVVLIHAEKDTLKENSFATMSPGETFRRKIVLKY